MKVDISLSIDKARIYMEFRAQGHRDQNVRKGIMFAFIILQKYFKSKWAHQLLHKFHLNRFSSAILPLFT